jgi:hypothetical protein
VAEVFQIVDVVPAGNVGNGAGHGFVSSEIEEGVKKDVGEDVLLRSGRTDILNTIEGLQCEWFQATST